MAKKRTGRQRANENALKSSRVNPNNRENTRFDQNKEEEPLLTNVGVKNQARNQIMPKNLTVIQNPLTCPPKGLVNLGNTCFFNSVMQNLCQTPGLLYILQENEKQVEFEICNGNTPELRCELPGLFKLSQAFLNFLITMGENSGNLPNAASKQRCRNRAESPKNLFNQICTVSPRFRGYQQQDSQELLQALLEGIKTEEIKRRKQAILTKLGLLRKRTTEVDPDLKEKVKNYGHVATEIPTIVDVIFGGKILSSVLCDECGRITQVTEDFLDISLPIVEGMQTPYAGNGKKCKKFPEDGPTQDSNPETNKSDVQPTQSKYAKKKQRKQERKINRRKRTKSQNTEDNEKNADDGVKGKDSCTNDISAVKQDETLDEERFQQNLNGKENGEIEDPTSEGAEMVGGSYASEPNRSLDIFKDEFHDNESKIEKQELSEDSCGPNEGYEKSDCMNIVTAQEDSGKQMGSEGDSTQETYHARVQEDSHQEDRETEQQIKNDEVDELSSQLDGMKIKENHVGTDFSTNDTRSKQLVFDKNHHCGENSISCELVDDSLLAEEKLASKAREIAHLAVANGIAECCQNLNLNKTPTINGDISNHRKSLLGGKMRPDILAPVSSGLPDVENEGQVNNSAAAENSGNEESDEDRGKKEILHTSPSSGNDEKEPSENDTGKVRDYKDGVSLFETPAKKPVVTFTSFCSKLPTSLSPRYEPRNQECSIQSCLHKFTMAEMLTGNNKFGCEECTKRQSKENEKPKTVYCNASKQMLVISPPLILTLQLKRFQQSGRSLRKFSKRVEIPVEFDLSPFCTYNCDEDHADPNGKILYRLYGVVEHSGSLSRGHYTSYVFIRPKNVGILKYLGLKVKVESSNVENGFEGHEGQWYHVSDTSVSKCSIDRALNCNAYLLFYERTFG